jgi:hypothetical protein
VPQIPGVGEAADEEIIRATIDNVLYQMSRDRKTTALKQLQVGL